MAEYAVRVKDILRSKAMTKRRDYSYFGDGYFACQEDIKSELKAAGEAYPNAIKKEVVEPKEDISREAMLQRVSDAMVKTGLTQGKIAEMTGINQSHISNYYCRKCTPSMESLAKLCVALNVSADYLLGLK